MVTRGLRGIVNSLAVPAVETVAVSEGWAKVRLAPLALLLTACAAPTQPSGPRSESVESSWPAGFVGTWAPRLENCRDFPWTFGPGRLDAPGEVFCVYPSVTRTPQGYRLAGACSGEAARERDEIEVSML